MHAYRRVADEETDSHYPLHLGNGGGSDKGWRLSEIAMRCLRTKGAVVINDSS
jgi:hypothetical protein